MSLLKSEGIDTPDLDARLLLMEAARLGRADLIARGQDIMTPEAAQTLEGYARCRLSGEPIDSILGYREFYGRRFDISKDVLSPRPETERLVDIALSCLKRIEAPRILDLGTGSGAILITILKESAGRGVGIDVSSRALDIARANAKAHGVLGRSEWHQSDWYECVDGAFDLIVSNPPYITDAAMAALPREVSGFDPDISLRGGADGLEAYAAILAGVPDYLRHGGALVMEIGYDQGRAVPAMMTEAGFSEIRVHPDLSGHDRVVSGIWFQK